MLMSTATIYKIYKNRIYTSRKLNSVLKEDFVDSDTNRKRREFKSKFKYLNLGISVGMNLCKKY